MSSKPHPAGARRVAALLEELDANELVIAEHSKYVEVLRTAEQARGRLRAELDELLRSMDTESVGNYGWSSRTAWLLAEVARIARGKS